MKPPGIGIIGLGLAAKPHALALRDLEANHTARVMGGFSPSAARRASFAATYGLPVVESMEVLLASADVQAVIILTPPNTHADLALRAARAGKHVLLEKPMEVTYAGAKALDDAIAATGKKLGVVFQFRFRPGALRLRELMAQHALGDLLSVSAAVRWWRSAQYYAEPGRGMMARDGGGVLITQAIHTLDLMLSLAGPVRRVAAQCRTSALRQIDSEDIACASIEFASGAVGVVDATTTAYPGFPERIEFTGTRGSAVLEAEKLTVHIHDRPVEVVEGSLAGGGGADPMAFSHEPHRRLIEDFCRSISANQAPFVSGTSALPVHALIDAMLLSSRTQSWVNVAGI